MPFEFATAGRIVFGVGRIRETGALARNYGQRALVVTGRSSDRAAELFTVLEASGINAGLFSVPGEPTTALVMQGAAVARERSAQVVIGFGGGSAMDAAKAIAAMATNPGDLLDYLEVIGAGRPFGVAPLPIITIPTTAGSGAEVTRNAVLASPEHRVKVSLRSTLLLARVAIVDPQLTVGLPASVTATTGMDALTQLVEAFVCRLPNPVTDGLCREGLGRIARALRRAFHEPGDAEAREDMCVGSLFGGLALANAGLGAVHGFAGPIGGMFPAPHGAVCAALLPEVMHANLQALAARAANLESLQRYQEVARLLTGDPGASAKDGVNWVRELRKELAIPGLRIWGIRPDDFATLAEKAAAASSMRANPIILTHDELLAILSAAC